MALRKEKVTLTNRCKSQMKLKQKFNLVDKSNSSSGQKYLEEVLK